MPPLGTTQSHNFYPQLPVSLLRYVTSGVFLSAAFSKIFAFAGLMGMLQRVGWFPEKAIPVLSLGLIFAELLVGFLLLSSRPIYYRLGGAGGVSLSLGFIAANFALLARGVTEGCSCLGMLSKPSPSFMLGVDVLLLGACAALLSASRKPLSGDRLIERAPSFSARRQLVRGAFCYVLLIASALQTGFTRQGTQNSSEKPLALKLHYDEAAPDFTLPSPSGKAISLTGLRGKWTLLSFVKPGCEPCHKDLSDLSQWYHRQKGAVNVVAVVMGGALFQSPEATARRFAQQLRLAMPVAADGDKAISRRYIGAPLSTPFHVLLDEQGRVQMVQKGRDEDRKDPRSLLVAKLDNVIYDVPLSDEQLAWQNGGTREQPAPDGVVQIQGREVQLSSLWQHKPLVLTFADKGCQRCEERFATMERTVGLSKAVNVLYVYGSAPEAQDATERHRTKALIGTAARATLARLTRAYGVRFVPATFVIGGGKLLYAPAEHADEFEVERAVLRLSSPHARKDSFNGKGKEVTQQRQRRQG